VLEVNGPRLLWPPDESWPRLEDDDEPFCVLPRAHAPKPTPNINRVMPMFPIPWKLSHQARTAGAMLWDRATRIRAEAKPAAKLLTLGCSEGR
jgi:hypothetical protein